MKPARQQLWSLGLIIGALALVSGLYLSHYRGRLSSGPKVQAAKQTAPEAPAPAALTTWPWPHATQDAPHHGVLHWLATAPDSTTVELFDFNFKLNPHLRFELYDQDEDDKTPFDNIVDYQSRGLGQVTQHLNQKLKSDNEGQVIAAWNGLFFGYHRKGHPATAFHVAPVVLRGKVYYTQTNHRWSFGVKYNHGKPRFTVLHLPTPATLAQVMDFGGGAAQCLIREGKPLKLQPFPKPGEPAIKHPMPSSPQEAGYIPQFDHMKTSRASIGWSRDQRHLYLLFVKEPDSEADSGYRWRWRLPAIGGWTVADVQRFWLSLTKAGKVWNAINSDAGGVGQLTYLRPDGNYIFVPPGAGNKRLVFASDFKNAPLAGAGGAIMYFYVRDGEGVD